MPDDSADDMSAADDGSVEPEPPAVVDLPELVTSGENNYWQEGQLSEASGNASISVDESDEKQEWMGFGGTFNEAGWDALSVLSEADKQLAIDLLFDAQDGANFKWGRIPMGSSDYAMSRYTLAETPDDFAMDAFSIDRDREMLIPFIKASLAVKPDVRLWASPWSPPAWMKTNNHIDGMGGGSEANMRSEPEILDAYSLYFAKFVEEYAAEGLVIEHVEPQNEPGYATNYPSCLWSPNLLRDFIRDYLGPTFVERGLDTEIWLGTMSAPEDTAHLDAVRNDSAASQFVKGYGLQWNTMGSVGSLAATGNPVIQTEHKCGNYPWETFNPDQPPNDHAYGVESWGLIRDWIEAGVHIYSAWNMVLDTFGHNLDEGRPWPQNALLVVDRSAGTLRATAAYYVFRHLSAFVQPGATRLGTSGGDALAFKNPDDSIIVVAHNSGGQASQTTLSAGGRTVQFEVPARGWATVNLE